MAVTFRDWETSGSKKPSRLQRKATLVERSILRLPNTEKDILYVEALGEEHFYQSEFC